MPKWRLISPRSLSICAFKASAAAPLSTFGALLFFSFLGLPPRPAAAGCATGNTFSAAERKFAMSSASILLELEQLLLGRRDVAEDAGIGVELEPDLVVDREHQRVSSRDSRALRHGDDLVHLARRVLLARKHANRRLVAGALLHPQQRMQRERGRLGRPPLLDPLPLRKFTVVHDL